MKVKVLQSFAGNGIAGQPGQEIDIDDDLAKSLIDGGICQPAKVSKRTTASKKSIETRESVNSNE